MKVFNGEEQLEFEKDNQTFMVILDKTQVNLSETAILQKYVHLIKKEEGIQVRYTIEESATPFLQACKDAKIKRKKLELACQLSELQPMKGDFRVPFIHPENIYFDGNKFKVIHYGLENLMSPKKNDEELLLKSIKALTLSIFQKKVSYEELLEGTIGLNDSFSKRISRSESLEELFNFLTKELVHENLKINQTKRLVSKNSFTFLRIFGGAALIFALIMTFFFYQYKTSAEKQQAIVAAQTSFITNNYAKTQTDLEKYAPKDLPKSAKYILAVSSVNLADLTNAQKQVILNTLSIKTDDNTLDYWVNMGRGNFDEALNLAQNLGDDQLTLLAYTDLYQATKLNTTMDGQKKQKLLQEYTKQIEEITKKLGK